MFDGMPEQFYQFLAAATTSRTVATNNTATTAASLPLPLSFSLHHHNHHASFPSYSPPPPPPPPPSFDAPYHQLLHHSQFLTRNNNQVIKDEALNLQQHDNNGIPISLMLPELPWSNDEMLALFRIRSSIDNSWFPDFIWENVSRKLAELGFKRSPEKCKQKFEEETRSLSNKINNTSNNYRLLGELEELCNNNTTNNGDQHPPPLPPPSSPPPPPPPEHLQSSLSQHEECQEGNNSQVVEGNKQGREKLEGDNDDDEEEQSVEEEDDDDSEKTEENTKKVMRKRKRQKKFEMLKEFCEQIVNKMMDQQEQLHSKILQDMVKRDEEKIAKEEAWKKQEIERLQKELEVRAHEQAAIVGDQAKILDCLNKLNSTPNILDSQFVKETLENLNKVPNLITLSNNSSILTHDSIISTQLLPTSSSSEDVALLNPIRLDNSKISLLPMDRASQNPNMSRLDHISTNATDQREHPKHVVGKDNDTGRRWPRDEVLALINIRCSLFNNGGGGGSSGGDDPSDRESFSKAPLWERISQKMREVGYKRSAKRCKEKWENINKYFRKTKDLNKKRSIDSRTCPYFQQLSHLYNQGTIMESTDRAAGSPESNRSMTFSGPQGDSSTPSNGGATNNNMDASQGNEGVVQVPGFDFEF